MNWAYLLRCSDNSLYAGWTSDLEKRLDKHNAGKGARYTRGRGPVVLAWCKAFDTQGEAMAEEARLKKLSKPEKERLVRGFDAAAKRKGTETRDEQHET